MTGTATRAIAMQSPMLYALPRTARRSSYAGRLRQAIVSVVAVAVGRGAAEANNTTAIAIAIAGATAGAGA